MDGMDRVGVVPPAWGLDAAQVAAVEGHRQGPALVIGPPGSGKTTVVAAAAALELAAREPSGPQPLVLTFARRSASQLRNRVARAMNRTVSPPWVTTMHAFCLWLLRTASGPGDPEPRLLTAPEQEFRVRELLAGRGAAAWRCSGQPLPERLEPGTTELEVRFEVVTFGPLVPGFDPQ